VGDYTKLETDQKGLYCEGKLWLGDGIPKAQQTYRMLKSKTGKGLSIGYSTKEYSMDEETGIRTLLKVKLHEISPTPFPMNEKAEITAVKTMLLCKDKLGIREAEEILRDVGLSHTEAKRFLALLATGLKESWDATRDLVDVCKSLTR
jgi:phage head maturation protease